MHLRALNSDGLNQFESYLARAASDGRVEFPQHLLEDDAFSYSVAPDVEVERKAFVDKFEAAQYLSLLLARVDRPEVDRNRGLWGWLALLYFDQLVQRAANGSRKVLSADRYIPSEHYQREYRHLLQGPYKLYMTHGETARVLLHKPVHIWSDLEEQLIGVQEVIQIPGLMEAVSLLYFDPERREAKRGATNRKKGGTVRRLRDVMQQIELTYDIYAMSGAEILQLLPREFDRFLPSPTRQAALEAV